MWAGGKTASAAGGLGAWAQDKSREPRLRLGAPTTSEPGRQSRSRVVAGLAGGEIKSPSRCVLARFVSQRFSGTSGSDKKSGRIVFG